MKGVVVLNVPPRALLPVWTHCEEAVSPVSQQEEKAVGVESRGCRRVPWRSRGMGK